MSIILGNLVYKFGADTSDLKRKQAEIISTNNKVTSSFNRVGAAITAAFTVEVLRRTILMVDSYKLLVVRIKNATKNQKDFNRAQKELLRISKETGTSFAANVRLFQDLTIAGKDLRATNNQVLLLAENVNKLGILGGSSISQMSNAMLQLGQALGGGVVRAEEFNSLLENTPLILAAIAKGMDTSTSGLRNMVIAGKLLSEEVFNVLLAQTDDINKRFEEFPLTIARASNELKTVWEDNLNAVDDVLGITEKIAKVIKFISDTIQDNFTPIVNELAKTFIDLFTKVENGFENIKAALLESGIESLRSFDIIGIRSDEFYDRQLDLIERNRLAQIKANEDASETLKQSIQQRLIGFVGPPEPEVTPIEVLGSVEFKPVKVSKIEKLLASMGDETQAILNALKERNNIILAETKKGSDEQLDLLLKSTKVKNDALDALERQGQKSRLDAMSQFGNSVTQLLEAAGEEQSAIGKAVFLANKALAVANIIVDTQAAAASVLPNLALAATIEALGFASAGLVAGTAIGQAAKGGGRQHGGIISDGLLHPVNENGDPELFQQGARQFVLGKGQGGFVTPMNEASNDSGVPKVIINNMMPGADVSVTSITRKEVVFLIEQGNQQTVNGINESLAQGRGSTATALKQGFKTERNLV